MADKPNTNPSGASDEQLKKGELVGKVRGRDVDESFHTPEFLDPETGEPLDVTPTVHDDSNFVKPEAKAKSAPASKDSKL